MDIDRQKECRTSPVLSRTGEGRETDLVRNPFLAAATLAILYRQGRLQTAAD